MKPVLIEPHVARLVMRLDEWLSDKEFVRTRMGGVLAWGWTRDGGGLFWKSWSQDLYRPMIEAVRPFGAWA